MLFFVNNQYLCVYYLLSPTINIERQKMENTIKPTKAYVSNRFIKKSISKAYKEFNNAPKISIKNKKKKNNIDVYDAQSLDLNDDNYIDYLSRRYERYPHSISFNAFVDNALSTKLAYDYLVNNVIPYDNDIFWEDLCPTRYFFKKWRSDFYDDIVCELVSYSGSVHFSDGASNVF